MMRRGSDWMLCGVFVTGEAMFAFAGCGLACAFVVLAAAVLGAN